MSWLLLDIKGHRNFLRSGRKYFSRFACHSGCAQKTKTYDSQEADKQLAGILPDNNTHQIDVCL